ncbi:unnamed protein product, partial [Polarella glacialis]
ALFAGCVPVILSDDVRLPFDDIVDWSSFSIRWPMAITDMRLYNYLHGLLVHRLDHILAMQRRAAEMRCWFDYFALEQEPLVCSPYLALLNGLAAKVKVMPRQRPAFSWPEAT